MGLLAAGIAGLADESASVPPGSREYRVLYFGHSGIGVWLSQKELPELLVLLHTAQWMGTRGAAPGSGDPWPSPSCARH